MDLSAFVAAARELSVVVALLVFVWGGLTRRWVWGHHYEDKCAEATWWKTYALSLHELTEKALTMAERQP